jgi:hypothetical protein
MLGHGQADSTSIVMKCSHLGIPSDLAEYAAPKALVPYTRGQMYYHEGLSLQECVLPCLVVQLIPTAKGAKSAEPAALMLSYRQGKSDCITTRRPVLDLVWPATSLFAEERGIEVALEASDAEGKIIGWVGSCSSLNPATGGVHIRPGVAISVGLRMEDTYSGRFTVRVLDAATNLQLTALTLRTGYME